MAKSKEEQITDYNAELTMIEASITRIYNSGQTVKKGASAGFSVEFASLSTLIARKETILNKLHTWEAS